MLKKQLTLKDPQTKILLITIGVIVATYFSSQRFIIRPHRDKASKLKGQLKHINLEDEIAKIYNDLKSSEKSLPPQKDPSWLLTQITELTSHLKLNIESIEPLSVKQIPHYSYVPFKMNITCTFGRLVDFIGLVESSPYILNIESLKIKSQGTYKPKLPKEELDKETQASVEIVIGTIY